MLDRPFLGRIAKAKTESGIWQRLWLCALGLAPKIDGGSLREYIIHMNVEPQSAGPGRARAAAWWTGRHSADHRDPTRYCRSGAGGSRARAPARDETMRSRDVCDNERDKCTCRYVPAMLATRPHKGSHMSAALRAHVGGTQWYALSATSMSLVAWHGACRAMAGSLPAPQALSLHESSNWRVAGDGTRARRWRARL